MNKSTVALASRLREVILNGTWIANTNYKDQLENLDWRNAITKIDSLNTIALLAQHVHYYLNGVKNVVDGGPLEIRDKYSFDFPELRSQKEWQQFLTKFWNDTEHLVKGIEAFPEEKLVEPFVDERYGTYQRNLDGLIEHCYYHLGQIVLIRKIIGIKR
ncbi:MAG: DUF1572 domain-containing protein [Bacteroidota bacterium]